MQNSIWKIVTAVGIIGIGTLVVLEVQHRLPQMQKASGVPELPDDAQEFVGSQNAPSEQFVTPDGTTDFDRLMSAADTESSENQAAGTFQFDEPALTEASPNTPPSDGQSSGALIASAKSASVDTGVRRSALYDGESPFAGTEGLAASAGSDTNATFPEGLEATDGSGSSRVSHAVAQQTDSQSEELPAVTTVAFQQNNAFSDDGGGAKPSEPVFEFPPLDLSQPAGAANSAANSSAASTAAGTDVDRTTATVERNPFGPETMPSGNTAARPDGRTDSPILFFSADPKEPVKAAPGAPASAASPPAVQPRSDETTDFFKEDLGGSDLPPLPPAGNNVPGDQDPFGGVSSPGAAGKPVAEPELPPFGSDGTSPSPRAPVRNPDTGLKPSVPNSGSGAGSSSGAGPGTSSKVREFSAPDSDPFEADSPDNVGSRGPTETQPPASRPGAETESGSQPFFTEDPVPSGGANEAPFPMDNSGGSSAPGRPVPRPVPGGSGNPSIPSTELPFPDASDFGNDQPGSAQPRAGEESSNGYEFPPLPDRPTGQPGRSPVSPAPGSGNPFDDILNEDPAGTPGSFEIPGRRPDSPADDGMFPGDPLDDRPPAEPGRGPGSQPPLPQPPIEAPDDQPTTSEVMRPHVTLRKDAPETASVGVALNYTITIANEGQATAYDVTVEDEVARGVNLDNTQPVADFDRTSRRLLWKFAELQPGESQQIRVTVTPTGEGTLDSTASVRFKSQVKASTRITAPRLSLQLSGPSEVRLGDEVNFRYVIRNDGSGNARDVILRSVLPAGLKHTEGNDLEYEISSLASGEEREIVLTVVASEPGEFKNTAEVTSSGVATAANDTLINIVGAQLKVERLGPERRYVGRPAQFQNIITNDTNFEATRCVVLERVPVGMKFVAAPGAQYNPQDRVISWKIDRIAPGKQVVLDVELTPEVPGDVDTIVEVVENAGFRSQATKTVAVEDIHNVSADISRLNGPVAVGEKFTFSITVDNRGTANANAVQLSIQVPQGIKVIAAGSKEAGITARHQLETNAVLYNPIVQVEPGHVKTFQLVLQGQQPVRNALVKAQLKYAEMQEPLVVSESVTVYSDSL